ncbi:hypothetical protein Tco_0303260 [Tanacetum coccineum]
MPANGCLKIDVFLMDDESNETIVCEVNEYRPTPGISMSGKKSAINALSILEWNGADKLVLWYPDPFTNIGEVFGNVLIQEDCSPRQFNITNGKVCVLTERMDFIQESIKILFLNETLSVRIIETDDDIDSLFNGYTFSSSSEKYISDSEGVDENPNQRAFGPMVWRFYPPRQGLMFESCLGR